MNTTNESLEELVKKDIIDCCTKHEEIIYFGALETCPVCNEGRKQKLAKKKLKVEPVKPEPEEDDAIKDTSIIGKLREYVQNPKNKGKVILMVIAVIVLCWLYLNSSAIMSYFK